MKEIPFTSSKAELRRTLRPSRGFSACQTSLRNASTILWERALGLRQLKGASQVGLYVPLPGEPQPIRALEWAFSEKRQPFLPKVLNETLLYLALDPLSKLIIGRYGLPEPIGGKPWHPRHGDVLFIPGLAFDTRGFRLGRGKGCFDRFLATLPACVIKVGICFESNLFLSLPADAWDQRVDIVVTEEQALFCSACCHELQPEGV